MAAKTYRSGTTVSVNIALPSGRSRHISFNALSNGTSVYTTSDEAVQKGLESHARYGRLFTLVSAANTPKPKAPKQAAGNGADASAKKVIKVPVSDWGTAKDYVADRFGVSRSALKSHAQIVAAAARNGVEFTGLE
ncbi:MAG: hypothetical protein LUE27_09035 [Clostridia bacterium]|nr:hypothetical protein [Clostridia bacterium]